jgi:pimeloyl-ACP methyl ester carboxylesterase
MAGVVVCPPLFREASENHAAELLLAEALVARGIAVQRFDYRGYGNSGGDAAQLTVGSAVEDCVLAGAQLRDRAGAEALAVVGTRWGALVAAGAVAALGAQAVAFWEAKPDGRGYVDELTRTWAFNDLWHGRKHPAGYHKERLSGGEPVDVLGWRVAPRLVASSVGESVARRLAQPLPARVVHGRAREGDAERLTADLESIGCDVTVSVLPERVLWWVGWNRLLHPEDPRSPLELGAEATAAWLAERLGCS